jgi:uncharacterized protein
MKLYTVRLHPNDELRGSLQLFAKEQGISAGFIITCVGALQNLTVRLAGATPDMQPTDTYNEESEIVSLVGTITADDCHLHIAVSDVNGHVRGGHLKSAKVGVTAEVVIGEDENVTYVRALDDETGFEELEVKNK